MASLNPELEMRRAIELSLNGFPSPNPRVGCVLWKDGKRVGEGFHAYAGGPHAERVALDAAGDLARGSTAFVTLEPCNHHGRTPPCSEALIEAGVAEVYFAVADPNPKAQGGLSRLAEAGIVVRSGLLHDEAAQANRVWHTAMHRSRPFIAAKVAMSLDGRVALPSGESKWITGPEARNFGHQLRAEYGAVLVGAGTVLADNPQLTVRSMSVLRQPARIVWDAHASLGSDHPILNEDGGAIVLNQEEPADVAQSLWDAGLTACLIEGGPKTWSSFLSADLVDILHIFIAPKLLGSGRNWLEQLPIASLSEAHNWNFVDIETYGADVCLTLSRPSM